MHRCTKWRPESCPAMISDQWVCGQTATGWMMCCTSNLFSGLYIHKHATPLKSMYDQPTLRQMCPTFATFSKRSWRKSETLCTSVNLHMICLLSSALLHPSVVHPGSRQEAQSCSESSSTQSRFFNRWLVSSSRIQMSSTHTQCWGGAIISGNKEPASHTHRKTHL